ncbi:class I SAM-dependent DNA methyltransferase [Streptomyces sp. NPDC002573]|uniref:HsdM family class I SAM-dependent methyltransferase n=1 Tax=Streptomyces sp. NPDC002573 TaxID=3364651 RepID=UPI003686AEA0
MTDFDKRPGDEPGEGVRDVFVSRSDIARLAGVRRPAVTNWERRHPDYPEPVAGESGDTEPERFHAREVLAWLSRRTVPATALRPGEPTGTTYGDRFRAGLTGGTAGGLLKTVERLTGPDMDRLRGPMSPPRYLEWLLHLVFLRLAEPDAWPATVEGFHSADREFDFPEKHFPRRQVGGLKEFLDSSPTASPAESRCAFEHVLTRLRDAEAGEGGEYYTPPSVSRVMAGALAAVQPGARQPHDPYCRSGELLAAYLDAVAAPGNPARPQVSGRVPQPRALRLARMNVRLHGADDARLATGPVLPALDPADPPGAFDLVITNPPFGGRVPADVPPPAYWTYGPARRTEYDWLQYAVSRLRPGGRAAVLMPSGAAFTAGAARRIRTSLVGAGVLECVMALPAGLFERTAIKTQIWFLRAPGAPEREVLFVAGEGLGHSVSRTRRALSDDDVTRLVAEYASWAGAGEGGRVPAGTPGLSRAVAPAQIAAHGHALDPSLYVRAAPSAASGAGDPAAVRDRLARLGEEIETLHARARAADSAVAEQLRRYGL